jgi:hypothetical protein
MKSPKNRFNQCAGVFKNSLIPFFPYQIDNNAEGDPFHPSNNVFPLILRPRAALLMVAIPLQSRSQDFTFDHKRDVQLQAKKRRLWLSS